MSEQLRPNTEHQHKPIEHENEPAHETHQPNHEKETTKEAKLDNLETIKRSIEQHAKSTSETTKTSEADKSSDPGYVTRELKQEALAHTMQRMRHHLSPVERLFSKAAHNKVIDSVSEVSGKTIGRPSGILGGALAACFGSLTLLMAAKHYGFKYNYGIILWLFILGFAAGLLIELSLRVTKHSKR